MTLCKPLYGPSRTVRDILYPRKWPKSLRSPFGGQHIDPRDALAEELARTRGDLQVLDAMVHNLELTGTGDGVLAQRLLHVTGMPTGDHAPHILVASDGNRWAPCFGSP